MKIAEKTIAKISDQVKGLLKDYLPEVNEAFLKSEKDFSIAFSVKIAPNGNGNKIETQINFVKERIKDTASGVASEIQADLFEKVKVCPVRGGERVNVAVCNKDCPLRCETIVVWGDQMPSVMEEIPSADEGLFTQSRSCSAWADEDHHAFIERLLNQDSGI